MVADCENVQGFLPSSETTEFHSLEEMFMMVKLFRSGLFRKLPETGERGGRKEMMISLLKSGVFVQVFKQLFFQRGH